MTGFNLRGPQPDEENPIGNPKFPGRTGSYGANYLGHMTVTYNDSFIKTYNMANRQSPFFKKRETMNMPTFEEQIETKFLKRYGPSTKPTSRSRQGTGVWAYTETLFVTYVGPDDIMQTFDDELKDKGSVSMEENLEAYMAGLEKLYGAGARNFLLVNYPQLENAPGIKNYGDAVGESKAYWRLGASIVQYNARLAFLGHMFAEKHPDANVFVFNTHKASLTVRLEPTRFPETAMYNHLFGYCFPYADDIWWVETAKVFDPGCTDGLINYFWRDEFHYSEPFQQLMARLMVELLNSPDQRLPQEFY